LAVYLVSKFNKRSNGSATRWEAIVQACPTVAETTSQKIGMGLRQGIFVFTISKSIVCAEGFRGLKDTLRTDHSSISIFFHFSSDTEIILS